MHIDHDHQVGVDDHPYCSVEFQQPSGSDERQGMDALRYFT
jgi:hypothetical protein